MAATDQTYRCQKTLDYVFAGACVLMLVGTVWMFVQDYFREYKSVQREFRDVEEAMAQRDVLNQAPDSAQLAKIIDAEDSAVKARAALQKTRDENSAKVNKVLPEKIIADDTYRGIKAEFDSVVSLYDISIEKMNAAGDPASRDRIKRDEVDYYLKEVKSYGERLGKAKDKLDQKNQELNEVMKPLQEADAALSKAEDTLKKLTADFDRFAKLAEQKRWGMGDRFRSLPVVDAFASPLRIQQTFHDDLPINYNFKYVTRYDRCTTCHLGIDRPTYTKGALTALSQAPNDQLKTKLEDAKNALKKRQEIIKSSGGLSPGDLQLRPVALKSSQVSQYAVHPRLDLFVDANSPHPGQQFGCTICHAGQGSATDFFNATHTPNDAGQNKQWTDQHHWHANHDWEYPMLPNRFIESSCVKCHHQMTDLVRDGSRIEAPKLMRGYNLVRENGCFGCHEIAGIKGGRPIGPDLRLEPTPPLDAYTPAERAKMTGDPLNPPGAMRKVGPSLRRISEKTNADWMVKWVHAPRDFRPDTKMPHFYGLSNNHPEILPPDQKYFPDAENQAVVHFLLTESRNYLQGKDRFRLANEAKKKELENLVGQKLANDYQVRELEEITARLERHSHVLPLPELPKALLAKATPEQIYNGRKLFSERGCLACHLHEGTHTVGKAPAGKPDLPTIGGEAQFGPNLSRIAAKLGTAPNDEASARRWLVQWIMNPSFHSPRTRMPVTHLDQTEANDVASWLLSIKVPAEEWTGPKVDAPSVQTLKDLARVFLSRVYTKREVEDFLEHGIPKKRLDDDNKLLDADERELETTDAAQDIEHKLKMYIGKKAVGQLGCYACHDIPGFENAKPIGTPLNDWGKKDPERLAFEDVIAYVRKNYQRVPKLTDEQGKPVATEDTRPLYEQYFYNLLDHHQREGFLYQKFTEPRSFDFDRMRVWDERLRMPQFRFARAEPKAGESKADFQRRTEVEEAEAREAVMTFILGLVAEPIPLKYVNHPAPDRMAEIKGRQVLDKYNCAGCHLVRSGVYEFRPSEEALEKLQQAYRTASGNFASDHYFADHNAWAGAAPTSPDRLTAFGLRKVLPNPDDDNKPLQAVQLTQALRFNTKSEGGKSKALDLPAFSTFVLPPELLPSADPYGGTFSDLLAGYLTRLDKQRYDKDDKTRPAVPPSLLREGEKTQPLWLFNFLRNPHEIRPVTVLRMPRFNMSDDEAMALVNYFAAVDKVNNPAMGLNYPYITIPEREEGYLAGKTPDYIKLLKQTKPDDKESASYAQRVKELKPLWQETLRAIEAQLIDARNRLKEAEAKVKDAQEAEKKEEAKDKKKPLEEAHIKAEEVRELAKKDVDRLQADADKNSLEAQQDRWATQEAYAIDGFHLMASEKVCLNCHQIGSIPPKEKQGPNLDLTWQRLRPDWTRRWLANPQRFMTYPTPMPQNFAKNATQFQDLFKGTPMEQLTSVRDVLMNYPRVMEMPANRSRPVIVAGGGK